MLTRFINKITINWIQHEIIVLTSLVVYPIYDLVIVPIYWFTVTYTIRITILDKKKPASNRLILGIDWITISRDHVSGKMRIWYILCSICSLSIEVNGLYNQQLTSQGMKEDASQLNEVHVVIAPTWEMNMESKVVDFDSD